MEDLMSLRPGEWDVHREISTPAAEVTKPGDIRTPLDTSGYESIFVGVVLTAGTAPTVTLDVYARDEAIAAGQPGDWMLLGSTSALASGETEEFETFHHSVYARTQAYTGTPTAALIKVSPGHMVGG